MILAVGEILADMIGVEKNGVTSFERYPGGAPFNVCCGINNLGTKVGFIGTVGDDLTGHYLADYVKTLNFAYSNIRIDKEHNTTLAFVENTADGDRKFSFNRKNTADYYFDDLALEEIKEADIILLGPLMLSEPEGIKTADKVVKLVKENNKLLSFDVNYRDDIYKSKEDAINISLKYVKEANIVKFSEEEVRLLSGLDDLDSGVKKITRLNQLVFVTLGGKGSRFYYNGISQTVPSIKIKPVDTTGAGDAFYAGILSGLDKKDIKRISVSEIIEIMKVANICGAMACMKKGALSSLPTKADLDKYLKML